MELNDPEKDKRWSQLFQIIGWYEEALDNPDSAPSEAEQLANEIRAIASALGIDPSRIPFSHEQIPPERDYGDVKDDVSSDEKGSGQSLQYLEAAQARILDAQMELNDPEEIELWSQLNRTIGWYEEALDDPDSAPSEAEQLALLIRSIAQDLGIDHRQIPFEHEQIPTEWDYGDVKDDVSPDEKGSGQSHEDPEAAQARIRDAQAEAIRRQTEESRKKFEGAQIPPVAPRDFAAQRAAENKIESKTSERRPRQAEPGAAEEYKAAGDGLGVVGDEAEAALPRLQEAWRAARPDIVAGVGAGIGALGLATLIQRNDSFSAFLEKLPLGQATAASGGLGIILGAGGSAWLDYHNRRIQWAKWKSEDGGRFEEGNPAGARHWAPAAAVATAGLVEGYANAKPQSSSIVDIPNLVVTLPAFGVASGLARASIAGGYVHPSQDRLGQKLWNKNERGMRYTELGELQKQGLWEPSGYNFFWTSNYTAAYPGATGWAPWFWPSVGRSVGGQARNVTDPAILLGEYAAKKGLVSIGSLKKIKEIIRTGPRTRAASNIAAYFRNELRDDFKMHSIFAKLQASHLKHDSFWRTQQHPHEQARTRIDILQALIVRSHGLPMDSDQKRNIQHVENNATLKKLLNYPPEGGAWNVDKGELLKRAYMEFTGVDTEPSPEFLAKLNHRIVNCMPGISFSQIPFGPTQEHDLPNDWSAARRNLAHDTDGRLGDLTKVIRPLLEHSRRDPSLHEILVQQVPSSRFAPVGLDSKGNALQGNKGVNTGEAHATPQPDLPMSEAKIANLPANDFRSFVLGLTPGQLSTLGTGTVFSNLSEGHKAIFKEIVTSQGASLLTQQDAKDSKKIGDIDQIAADRALALALQGQGGAQSQQARPQSLEILAMPDREFARFISGLTDDQFSSQDISNLVSNFSVEQKRIYRESKHSRLASGPSTNAPQMDSPRQSHLSTSDTDSRLFKIADLVDGLSEQSDPDKVVESKDQPHQRRGLTRFTPAAAGSTSEEVNQATAQDLADEETTDPYNISPDNADSTLTDGSGARISTRFTPGSGEHSRTLADDSRSTVGEGNSLRNPQDSAPSTINSQENDDKRVENKNEEKARQQQSRSSRDMHS